MLFVICIIVLGVEAFTDFIYSIHSTNLDCRGLTDLVAPGQVLRSPVPHKKHEIPFLPNILVAERKRINKK